MKETTTLLVSDLDGTLIDPRGVDAALLARFRALVDRDRCLMLAYVTGRHHAHALEGITAADLPLPDVLGSNVGTELRIRENAGTTDRWRLDEEFAATMRTRSGGETLDGVDAVVLARSQVRAQPSERSGPFKRSFWVDDAEDRAAFDHLVAALQRDLDREGLSCSVLPSIDPDTRRGLVDVLPRGVTKADVVAHLRARTRLDDRAIVYAGDAGNDLGALCGPWRAIVVGNADPEIRRVVAEHAARTPSRAPVVFARARTLAGVLEGLEESGWNVP